MTDEAGQAALRRAADLLLDDLDRAQSLLSPNADVEYFEHRQFATRLRSLGVYLRSAVAVGAQATYAPAFALVRSAYEHHFIDALMFLGDRFEQLTDSIDKETWEEWQASRPPDVLSWDRQRNGRVHIVWRGLRVDGTATPGDAQNLSIYYAWWTSFDPFVVSARDRTSIAPGHPEDLADATAYSRFQQELWSKGLAWTNLKSNLVLNSLCSAEMLPQLDVHYRFLSAFTHPASQRATELPYPRNAFEGWPVEDHYSSELVLLYTCFLAVEELKLFEAMSHRPPSVGLREWSTVARHIADADRLIEHAWFPGRRPFTYDRVVEANQRAFDKIWQDHAEGRPPARHSVVDPRLLEESDIRYYSNPLYRVVQLHGGFHEALTDLSWMSPWPRPDAAIR